MALEFVETKFRGDKVTIFLKPSYPYFASTLPFAFKAGHLECIDITGRRDMSSLQDYFLEITGARTVFIGEECVGGCSDVAELDESGKLEGMLQSIGAL
uniref:Glutaredoxin (thioltransferase) n=1 Tax=Oncorhynchus mykiss TaxID=8022 RepID=A0A8C7PEJ3_ONCMY